jgi:translation initiation factor 2 subunit 3
MSSKNTIRVLLSELQENQAIAQLAFLGSVAAGKSTINKALTGETTQKHTRELINGCTINMGYVNIKIYYNASSKQYLINPKENDNMQGFKLLRHFSSADNPGHNAYMSTLITGINTVDNVIFLVSGTNGIEPQTKEHMKCFRTTGCKNYCFVISKADLIPTKIKLDQLHKTVNQFIIDEIPEESDIDLPPVIPLSAQSGTNMDKLIQYIVASPYPRALESSVNLPLMMPVVRSFDINRPGVDPAKMTGATIGGALMQGFVMPGDIVCLLPGIVKHTKRGFTCIPLHTQIVEIRSDTSSKALAIGVPGGFLGLRTTLDPGLAKANGLVGQVLIKKTNRAAPFHIVMSFTMTYEQFADDHIKEQQSYLLAIHCATKRATLVNKDDSHLTFQLDEPIALMVGEKVVVMTSSNAEDGLSVECYGNVTQVISSDNIEVKDQPDMRIMAANDLSDVIDCVEIVNDLEEPPISVEDIMESLYDFNNTTDNMTFSSSTFSIDCPQVNLQKTDTSITITNPSEIFSNFTTDAHYKIQLYGEFAKYIQTNMDGLGRGSVVIDHVQIGFHKLKHAQRKWYIPQFNKELRNFVALKFTCNTCKTVGSLLRTEVNVCCRKCKAVQSVFGN